MIEAIDHDSMIGRHFGGAVVVRLIGTGGMGAVYEAENPVLGKRYAIKVVLPELAANGVAVERFLQEARSAAIAEHPRIVPILDCGYTDDGRPFQTMPLLSGQDFDSYCAVEGAEEGHPGRLELTSAAHFFFQILDGLAVAHRRQIVHRDLKGANIQVLSDRTIKILDFGIAKLFDPARQVVRTGSFQVLGTPGYMAPEQARAAPIDYRADLWALGAVFFRALTGRLPFEGSDFIELAARALIELPPSPTDLVPAIPEVVSDVLLSCLAANPDDRPDSAAVVAHALMAAVPGGRAIAEAVAPDLMPRGALPAPILRPRRTRAARTASSLESRAPGAAIATLRAKVSARPTHPEPAVPAEPAAIAAPAGLTLRLRGSARRLPRLLAAIAALTSAALAVTAIVLAGASHSPGASRPAGTSRSADASRPPGADPRAQAAATADTAPATADIATADIATATADSATATADSATATADSATATADSAAAHTAPPTADSALTIDDSATADSATADSATADPATADSATATTDTTAGPDAIEPARERRRSARTESGMLVITANPFAEVWIDGQRAGSTPFTRVLPVGRYRVRLLGPESASEITKITIRAGQTQRIDRTWSGE